MDNKQIRKRYLSLFLALMMLIGILPLNIFAATPLANWGETTKETEFWPTPPGVTYDDRGLTTTPWTGYDIGFDGFSTDGAGRTVINLKLMAYSSANPNTVVAKYNYQYAQFKFSPELEKMIDFDKTFVGTLRYQNQPNNSTAADRIKFSNSTPAQKGVHQVKMDQLVQGGTYASRVWNLPVKIVLKDAYDLNSIKEDYLVQSRFLNLNENMYYARINRNVNENVNIKLNGYNAYTFSTIVPGKSSVRRGEIANRATYNDANNLGNSQQEPLFTQRTVISNYDEKTGKLYIFHGALKQVSYYDELDNGNIGYRISFDSRFKEYLKTDKVTGAVGYISLRDDTLKPYPTTKTAYLNLTDANTIGDTTVFQIGTNNFEKTEGITNKTVVNDNINEVYLHGAATTLSNLFTIAVFDIDQDKLMKESFTDPNKVIESFAVRTSFVLDTQDTDFNNVQTNGWSKYSYTVPNNITIPANGKITITTDKLFGSSLFGIDALGDNYITKAKQLLVNIGGDEGMTYLMPSKTGEYRGLTVVKNNQKRREFEIPFREGQTLKAGETIDVYIPMDVRKEGTQFLTDNAVNLIFKDNTGTNLATAKITSDQSTKVKPARTLENGDKLTGVIFDRTLMPVLDEIFTDSTEYKGHSLYPESKVMGHGTDETKKETVFVGTTEDPTEVNGKTYTYAYKFTNTNFANPLTKDLPIKFYNQDIGRLPSETVTEQVQAKVTFDLNGGELPTTVKSFEGYNEVTGQTHKDMDYKVARDNVSDNVVRIAPMNVKYSNDPAYVANGFEGENASFKDHNGKDLGGDALELRKFVVNEPTKTGVHFLGWSTKKIEGTAADATTAWNALTEADTVAKTHHATQNYKFTKNSPITKGLTVYAVYGLDQSQVTNPKQTYDEAKDKQYVEVTPEEGKSLPTDATYKLVKKNSDGTYTPVENLTATEVNGKTVFDITDLSSDKFDPNADYYIETTETGKNPSYSDTPIKIDKVAPTIIKEGDKNFTVVQDHYGYQVKISATANDNAGILRVYAQTDKDGGYYKQEASETTANLSESIQNQLGEQKTFTVTAVDKFGNKTEVTETVEPKAATLSLKAERPLGDTDFIYVTTTAGANLEIKVINKDNTEVLTMTHTQGAASEEIKLVKDGAPFKLTKGQRIKITATSGNQTAKLTIRVR